jgi:hypothetical protein
MKTCFALFAIIYADIAEPFHIFNRIIAQSHVLSGQWQLPDLEIWDKQKGHRIIPESNDAIQQ